MTTRYRCEHCGRHIRGYKKFIAHVNQHKITESIFPAQSKRYTHTVSAAIPDDLYERLKQKKRETGYSMSHLLRSYIHYCLKITKTE